MKKGILSMVFLAAFVATSCGDSNASDNESGPSLCDCVNATEKTEECLEMEREWVRKYGNASQVEKVEMKEELEKCVDQSK